MIDFKKLCPYLEEKEINELEELRNSPSFQGAIVNIDKIDLNELVTKYQITKDEEDKYLIRFNKPLGKTVEHMGGGLYIMDPSATIVSRLLKPTPNEIVLDLCASPGGKTISYAIKNPNSLIVSNEISSSRINILKQNIERLGLTNIIITNHDINYFVDNCQKVFDKIILDVPCSGNGMYRKEKELEDDFSFEKINRLLPIQKELLNKSKSLLKNGGTISYSTCSFSQKEDEEQILNFLKENDDFELIEIKDDPHFLKTKGPGIYLLPTRFLGEGQYICLMKQKGDLTINEELKPKTFTYKNKEYYISKFYKLYECFAPLLPGVSLFNPNEKSTYSHAYSRTLTDYKNTIVLIDEEIALDYLHGDEINCSKDIKGEVLIKYKNLSLGWGKASNGKIKNYLPKGVRLQSR